MRRKEIRDPCRALGWGETLSDCLWEEHSGGGGDKEGCGQGGVETIWWRR